MTAHVTTRAKGRERATKPMAQMSVSMVNKTGNFKCYQISTCHVGYIK